MASTCFLRRSCVLAVMFTATWMLAAGLLSAPSRAQGEVPVDVLLALAVDASGSVNGDRFELQKRGYVAALRNPRVLQAIHTGSERAIAIRMFQWTGPALQVAVTPWMRIHDSASAERAAAAIDAAPRQLYSGGTSISGAIDYGVRMLAEAPFQAQRRIIDVSGDGTNNRGRPAAAARDDAVRAGLRINGLPILALEPWLDDYYRDNVIGGPGSFFIAAASYETFAEAILRKLILEISWSTDDKEPIVRARATSAAPAFNWE